MMRKAASQYRIEADQRIESPRENSTVHDSLSRSGDTTMSEENKAPIRRYVDELNQEKDMSCMDELLSMPPCRLRRPEVNSWVWPLPAGPTK